MFLMISQQNEQRKVTRMNKEKMKHLPSDE